MDSIQALALDVAGSPWVYLLVFACCTIDGFFPPIPSETVVIALAATWASAGVPNPWLLVLAAALGAFVGDQVAFAIGRRIDPPRFRLFRSEKGAAALDWARHALDTRGASFIIAARFVPVGRVAVNMTAGAVGFPWRRFAPTVVVAALIWAAYGFAIGALAGHWLHDRPLVAVVVGVVAGLLIGLLVDPVMRRLTGAPRS